MRDFVGRLLRALPVGRLLRALPVGSLRRERGRGRVEAEKLANDVVRFDQAGRYREATIVSRRLVDLQRSRLGTRHPDLATAKTSLALLLRKQGECAEPEPLLREALALRREALGELHPQYAASLGHLADLLQQRGDLDAAEPLMRQALEVGKNALGDRHPNYAASLTALALLLHRRGAHADAEPLLRQALAIRREALGARHPMTATALSNLGRVLHRRGGLADAEPLLREALAIRREVLGDRHPDIGASLSHLGTLLFERGDSEAAEPLLQSAVDLRAEALGSDHPEVFADRHALDALMDARNGMAAPATTVEVAAPVLRPALELAGEARALAESFSRAASGLALASARMTDGLPPDAAVLVEAEALRLAFARRMHEARQRAETLNLDLLDADSISSLAALLDRVSLEEIERLRRDSAFHQAVALLDRVLTLRHRDPALPDRVRPALDAASSLRLTVGSPEIALLLDGSHPLATLLSLLEPASLTDDAWSLAYRTASSAFGPPLAAAAARGRLFFDSK